MCLLQKPGSRSNIAARGLAVSDASGGRVDPSCSAMTDVAFPGEGAGRSGPLVTVEIECLRCDYVHEGGAVGCADTGDVVPPGTCSEGGGGPAGDGEPVVE